MSFRKQKYHNPTVDRAPQDRYGNPGNVLYTPLDEDHVDRGSEWHISGRWSNAKPTFRQLNDFTEWHYPTKLDESAAFPSNLRPVRVQQRWLYSHIPETAAAVDEITPLLAEELSEPAGAKEPPTKHALMATGYIEGFKKLDEGEVLIMATATGKAGDILRLNSLATTPREWDRQDRITLKVQSGMAEETFWREHFSPISNIKFWSGRMRRSRMRLILVQQPAATTIFNPMIHKMPVDGHGMLPGQKPSFIEMNPVLTLRPDQTGGSPHADVEVNPGTETCDPQVAIIDESGYWSVWDMTLFRRSYRALLRACGHVRKGFLPCPPSSGECAGGDRFRLLWVSRMKTLPWPGYWDDVAPSEAPFYGPQNEDLRAHCLLVSDNATIRVVDLDRRVYSPALVTSIGPTKDRILDLKACPLGTSLAFVLTEKTLRLFDVLPNFQEDRVETMTPQTLLAIPHGHGKDDTLLLGIAPDTLNMHSHGYLLVYIYSNKHTRVDFIWIRIVMGQPRSAQFYRITQTLTDDSLYQGATGSGFRSLSLQPIKYKARLKGNFLGGPGTSYFEDGVQFYSLVSLDQRLAVRHALCAVSSVENNMNILVPEIDVYRKPRRYLRHKEVFQYTAETFATPDSFALFDVTGLRTHHPLVEHVLEEDDWQKQPRDITKFVPQYLRLFFAQGHPEGDVAGVSMTDVLGDFTQGLEKRVPFTTLRELAWRSNANNPLQDYCHEWLTDLNTLEHETPLLVLSPLDTLSERPVLQTLYEHFYSLYLKHRPRVSRSGNWSVVNCMVEQAVQEAACDIFLSSFTLIETRLLPQPTVKTREAETSSAGDKHTDAMDIDADLNIPSQSQYKEPLLPTPRPTPSLRSTPGPTPTPEPDTPAQDFEDALSRLSTLAISCNEPTSKTCRTKLLSRWQTLGEDTKDYVWRRDEEEEAWMVQLKARKSQEADKKRRRTERYKAIGLGGEGDFGSQAGPSSSTLPSLSMKEGKGSMVSQLSRGSGGFGFSNHVQTRQSQGVSAPAGPFSSQTHIRKGSARHVLPSVRSVAEPGLGISMSQPVLGAFGGTLRPGKKAKAGKKRAKGF